MAVPRNRHSNRRKLTKRSHSALEKTSLASCSNCKNLRQAHHACPHCGHYKGRSIVD